jgi:hypothetical protein
VKAVCERTHYSRTEGCAPDYHSPHSHPLQRASIITRPIRSAATSVCQSPRSYVI